MQVNNVKYKNQGIHVIASIFTIDNGIIKVLLIRRNNEPYKDMWALVGGALYNDETLDHGMRREILEKSGLKDINLHFSHLHDNVKRSPVMRMIAVSYVGLIDSAKVNVLKNTKKTFDAEWFPISNIPPLAYDHNEIIASSLKTLQEKIENTDILKSLFSQGFTIPEVQKAYETILGRSLERRNFRKKILNNELIIDTNTTKVFEGNKPAKLYKFKD